ncbi:hypothetical protein Hanom_Chr03g00234701 [Helianthus anomalus]
MYKYNFGSRGMISSIECNFGFWRFLSLPIFPPGNGVHKINISKITPPASPPSRHFNLSPPHPDSMGKEKEDEVEQVRNVAEDVAAGAGGGEAYVEGAETEVESREATPQQGTIYTKRVRNFGEGGASCVRQSPKFKHV